MLSATEDGKWVSYVYRNPESGGELNMRTTAIGDAQEESPLDNWHGRGALLAGWPQPAYFSM